MKVSIVLILALISVVMAENFRPISKVLTSPAYDYDHIVVYNVSL